MDELRIGIVGLGWVAGAHIDTFKKVRGARVTAIASRTMHDPKELEKRYGLPLEVFPDLPTMLRDASIDVVDICTPHPFHPDQAVQAANAGKHLIIEKPLGLTWEDSLRIHDAVLKAKVRTCVCFECRFSMHFTLVRALIDQGLLGEIHYGEVDYFHGIGPWYGQFPWNVKREMGGSSLLTAGCHALDALLYFMNEPVTEVSSFATSSKNPVFAPYEYPTTTATLLRFASGHVGKCASVIDCLQPYDFHVHLVGSEGSVLNNRFTSLKLPGLRKDQWSTLATVPVDSGDVKDHPYLPQFQAFVDAVHQGTEMPKTSLEDAMKTHRAVFAADRSVAEGRPVRLEEFRSPKTFAP